MITFRQSMLPLITALACCVSATAERNPAPKIAWYGQLDMGLQQAAKTNRPILLISGAPHCHGVPGTW